MTNIPNNTNVRTNTINKKIILTYVIKHPLLEHLKFPIQFQLFAKDQQQDIFIQLIKLDKQLQQRVLDEWAIRCQNETIHRPVGYLFQIIKKAQKGLFHPCVSLGVQYDDKDTPENPLPNKIEILDTKLKTQEEYQELGKR